MADKSFGVKQLNLIGASGTPKIESPNNLNLNAINVAISTDLSIGGQVNSNIIVSSGYSIGIGTTNPTSALTVSGDTSITGVTTSVGGFTSGIGVTDPVQITVSGNVLTFTVVGVGSTSLTLY